MPKKVLNLKDNSTLGGKVMPVPKLDLTKAKKIQEINAKKSTQQQVQPAQPTSADIKALEKLKTYINSLNILTLPLSVEAELDIKKKLISREMVNNKELTDELSQAIEENRALITNNDTYVRSNKRYEEKWQKIFYTLEFYKEFYYKYIDLITNKYIHNKPSSNRRLEKLGKLSEKFNIDITESNPDQLIKGLKKIDEENGKLMNISMLEAEDADDDHDDDEDKNEVLNTLDGGNRLIELTKDQSKIYLMNLAKDLYVNTNINKGNLSKNMIKMVEEDNRVRHKKSQSNPFDYIDENSSDDDHKIITSIDKVNKQIKINIQQTQEIQHTNLQLEEEIKEDNRQETYSSGQKHIMKIVKRGEDDLSFSMAKVNVNEVSFISNNDMF